MQHDTDTIRARRTIRHCITHRYHHDIILLCPSASMMHSSQATRPRSLPQAARTPRGAPVTQCPAIRPLSGRATDADGRRPCVLLFLPLSAQRASQSPRGHGKMWGALAAAGTSRDVVPCAHAGVRVHAGRSDRVACNSGPVTLAPSDAAAAARVPTPARVRYRPRARAVRGRVDASRLLHCVPCVASPCCRKRGAARIARGHRVWERPRSARVRCWRCPAMRPRS